MFSKNSNSKISKSHSGFSHLVDMMHATTSGDLFVLMSQTRPQSSILVVPMLTGVSNSKATVPALGQATITSNWSVTLPRTTPFFPNSSYTQILYQDRHIATITPILAETTETTVIQGKRSLIFSPSYNLPLKDQWMRESYQQYQLSLQSCAQNRSVTFINHGQVRFPINVMGMEVYVENAAARKAFESGMTMLFQQKNVNGKVVYRYPETLRTIAHMTQTGIQAGEIRITIFDSKQVASDAAALTIYRPGGVKEVLLRSQGQPNLLPEAMHEWCHAVLDLANVTKNTGYFHDHYAHPLRVALCHDYLDYRKSRSALSPMQKHVAHYIFRTPRSYPRIQQATEQIPWLMQAMTVEPRATRSVAPRYCAIVDEYVSLQAQHVNAPSVAVNDPLQSSIKSYYKSPHFQSLSRAAAKSGIFAFTALSTHHKWHNEQLSHPEQNFTANIFAVAGDIAIEHGELGLLLLCEIPAILAIGALVSFDITCNLADQLRSTPIDAHEQNKDLFFAYITSLDLSPSIQMDMLNAFDRGEEWTRKLNRNVTAMLKTTSTPLALLHDTKKLAITICRQAGEVSHTLFENMHENEMRFQK